MRTLSKPAATLEGYIYFPLSVDCSGPYVCTGSNGFNNVGCEVRVWDRRKNAQVFEPLVGHEHAVMGLALLRGIGGNGGGHAAGDGGGLYAASGSKDGEVTKIISMVNFLNNKAKVSGHGDAATS